MLRKNFPDRKNFRRQEAQERQKTFSNLSLNEKISKLQENGYTCCSEYKFYISLKEKQNG